MKRMLRIGRILRKHRMGRICRMLRIGRILRKHRMGRICRMLILWVATCTKSGLARQHQGCTSSDLGYVMRWPRAYTGHSMSHEHL